MKKYLSIILALVMITVLAVGCSPTNATPVTDEPAPATGDAAAPESAEPSAPASTEPSAPAELKVLKVGASPTPHAEILKQVVDVLKEQGIDLQIIEFTDYVQPNLALQDGSLDANFFQHLPYLESFNAEKGTTLVSIGAIHYEPFGLYPGKTKTIAELKDGASISVPNDTSNEARALLLLEAQGLIKLKEGAGITATKLDIVENPKNIDIKELEAAQLVHSLPDVDMAVINGNFAIQGGLTVEKDAIAKEDKASIAATTYANIIAVRAGDEARPELVALVEALKSDAVKAYIDTTYAGAVVPAM